VDRKDLASSSDLSLKVNTTDRHQLPVIWTGTKVTKTRFSLLTKQSLQSDKTYNINGLHDTGHETTKERKQTRKTYYCPDMYTKTSEIKLNFKIFRKNILTG
jgi:hypothetical protein